MIVSPFYITLKRFAGIHVESTAMSLMFSTISQTFKNSTLHNQTTRNVSRDKTILNDFRESVFIQCIIQLLKFYLEGIFERFKI